MNIEKLILTNNSLSNIYGQSFQKGCRKLNFIRLYLKNRLTFDFSSDDAKVMALDLESCTRCLLHSCPEEGFYNKHMY
jgi:hypothetical protein